MYLKLNVLYFVQIEAGQTLKGYKLKYIIHSEHQILRYLFRWVLKF